MFVFFIETKWESSEKSERAKKKHTQHKLQSTYYTYEESSMRFVHLRSLLEFLSLIWCGFLYFSFSTYFSLLFLHHFSCSSESNSKRWNLCKIEDFVHSIHSSHYRCQRKSISKYTTKIQHQHKNQHSNHQH